MARLLPGAAYESTGAPSWAGRSPRDRSAGGGVRRQPDRGRRRPRTPPAGSDLGAIEHVVFLMQENRSFDHYFGTYRGARGFDDHTAGPPRAPSPSRGPGTDGRTGRLGPPVPARRRRRHGECTHDLNHFWAAQHQCWNHGANDAFVATHASAAVRGAVLRRR